MFRWIRATVASKWLSLSNKPRIKAGERPLNVFISSVMIPELEWARNETVSTIDRKPYLKRWCFEHAPGSSEPVEEGCLCKVQESEIFIWLVGKETTIPVRKEVQEALASVRHILVMKLLAKSRDPETESLLQEVGPHAKWMDVTSRRSLREALDLTLDDELVRAMRSEPALGRIARLDEIGRASRARCISRWQALGVPSNEAMELADNPLIGDPSLVFGPSSEKPLILMIGELGIGKSLIAERILQGALTRAREKSNIPIPIYLEAAEAVGHLREAAEKAAKGLGNPKIQGAVIIIDGADETGLGPATELLNEARILVRTWPKTTIIITSRPIPNLIESEEAVQVPLLLEAEAHALIARFAGRPITVGISSKWPPAIRDAIHRPLFAILLGNILREQDIKSPNSIGELLTTLIERTLKQTRLNINDANKLLQRLGAISTDCGGGAIPIAEIASIDEIEPLIESGLVVKRNGIVYFPLPILTQWFAAQSLAAGIPTPQELIKDIQRLEYWRYALIIFCSHYSFIEVSKMLSLLAEKNPAFAAEVVSEGIAQWGTAKDVMLPSSLECGRQVRSAMQAWIVGIGPLSRLIAPIRKDSILPTIGAQTKGCSLVTAWYRGDKDLDEVISLSSELINSDQILHDWYNVRFSHSGRQPAWAWRWALDEIINGLSKLLRARALPVEKGPLEYEALWYAALAITGRNALSHDPIPISELKKTVSQLPNNTDSIVLGRKNYSLIQLNENINQISEKGEMELCSPWPRPDKPFTGGWKWEAYSPERLLLRAQQIYDGAIKGYKQLVEKWFPKFSHRLQTMVTLPARLVGVIYPPCSEKGIDSSPRLEFHFEPLSYGMQTIVDFRLGESTMRMDSSKAQHLFKNIKSLRPEAASWLGINLHYQILDVFDLSPATKLAYEWLWDDLRRVYWIEGTFGNT